MSKPDDIDDVTGLSVSDMEALAEDLYQHRDELAGDEVPSEVVSEVRSVVSVRFSRAELDEIAAAAAAADQPLSTYIRNAALAASAVIDIERARRQFGAVAKAIEELGRSLGTAA